MTDPATLRAYDDTVPDSELDEFDLEDRYDTEHPEHSVAAWRHAVAEGDTFAGYWRWVSYRLA